MRQLIRSQFYTLRSTVKLLIPVYIILTLINLCVSTLSAGFNVMDYYWDFKDTLHFPASTYFGLSGNTWAMFSLIFVLISVGLVCATDFDDKTINYEIAYGHSRRSVFLARAITAMTTGTIGGLLVFLTVPIIMSFIFGWGNEIPLSTAAERTLILTLLFMRVSAEIIFVTAIARRTYLVYIIAVAAALFELMVGDSFDGSIMMFAITAYNRIMNFRMFPLNHFDKTLEFYFDAARPDGEMITAAVSYAATSVCCILFGVRWFERSDIN